MSGGRRGTNKTFTLIESDIVTVGTSIELGKIDVSKPHCFAGVQFFTDATGDTPAVPTAGSVSIEVQTLNNFPRFEFPSGFQISAFTPTTVSWAANTLKVKATPTQIDIATHYRLVVTCNET